MPVSTPTHKFPHPFTMCNEASMNIEIIGMSTPHPPNLRWVPPTLVGVTPPPKKKKKKKRKYLLYLGNIPVKFQNNWNKTSSVIVWTNPSDYGPPNHQSWVVRWATQNFAFSTPLPQRFEIGAFLYLHYLVDEPHLPTMLKVLFDGIVQGGICLGTRTRPHSRGPSISLDFEETPNSGQNRPFFGPCDLGI